MNASKPALLSSSASVTFFVRSSVSFCYLYQSLSCLFLPLAGCLSSCMSLPSQPLDICLTSATRCPFLWAGPAGSLLVISLPVPLITLIGSSVWGLAVFWPPLHVWPSTSLVRPLTINIRPLCPLQSIYTHTLDI